MISFLLSSFFYHSMGDGFMGLILGDGVPLPASRGEEILRSITTKDGLWYSFVLFCAESMGGGVVCFICLILFN